MPPSCTVGAGDQVDQSGYANWGTLTVNGTYNIQATVDVDTTVTINAGGMMNLQAPGVVLGVGGALTNSGSTVVTEGSVNAYSDFSSGGSFNNASPGIVLISSGDPTLAVLADNSGAFTNAGTFYVENPAGQFGNSGSFDNSGVFRAAESVTSLRTPVINSGSFTLLPGPAGTPSSMAVGSTAAFGFTNTGTLKVSATDGTGQMLGYYLNNTGGVVDLAPASGVQSFSINGTVVGNNITLTGPGTVQKTGAGTTLITMAMPYTGPTTVSAGVLLVNGLGFGSIANSSSAVQSGATLGGDGTVGPVTVQSGGILSPGDSLPASANTLGTLYATGNVLLNASSTTLFELAAPTAATPTAGTAVTAGDLVAITGDLAMNGTLKIAPQTGFAEGAYKIFTYTGALSNGATVDASALQPLGLQAQLVTTVAGEVWLFITKAPAPQTISYSSTPPSPAVVGAPYTAVATATSGLPVALTSTTPTVCTVDAAGVVSLLAPGTCSLAADQAGDSAWLAAPQVLQSFVVTAAPVITPPVVTTGPAPVPTMHPLALALMGLLAALVGGHALRRRTV